MTGCSLRKRPGLDHMTATKILLGRAVVMLLGRDILGWLVATGQAVPVIVARFVQLIGDDRHSGYSGGSLCQITDIVRSGRRCAEAGDGDGGGKNGRNESSGHGVSFPEWSPHSGIVGVM